jgi:hypothetical protein
MLKTARMCRASKGSDMAKLVFGMNQSLDGYVDHMAFSPSPTLFRHFIEEAQGQADSPEAASDAAVWEGRDPDKQ